MLLSFQKQSMAHYLALVVEASTTKPLVNLNLVADWNMCCLLILGLYLPYQIRGPMKQR